MPGTVILLSLSAVIVSVPSVRVMLLPFLVIVNSFSKVLLPSALTSSIILSPVITLFGTFTFRSVL